MVDPGVVAQLTVNGLLSGGILALAAMGLTIIFGVMDVVNFAHGTYVMLAMYAAFVLWQFAGLQPFVAMLVVAPLFFVFGVATQKVIIEPIIEKPMFAQVFATLGLLWIYENLALYVFGPAPRSVNAGFGGVVVGGVAVEVARFYGFVVAVAVTLGLYAFLFRTKTGLAIRATAQSRQLAQPFGVNIDRIYMLTFGIGIALVGLAGSVIMSTRSVEPTTGNYYVLLSFVIVTLGGLGSVGGAFLGGLLIGVLDSYISFYISPALAPPIYFAIFIGVLVLRATGRLDFIRYRVRKYLPTGGMSH
ncbi:MAG: branched-chain amino acid ABC transporter permease [Haloarculaceae archaeon]